MFSLCLHLQSHGCSLTTSSSPKDPCSLLHIVFSQGSYPWLETQLQTHYQQQNLPLHVNDNSRRRFQVSVRVSSPALFSSVSASPFKRLLVCGGPPGPGACNFLGSGLAGKDDSLLEQHREALFHWFWQGHTHVTKPITVNKCAMLQRARSGPDAGDNCLYRSHGHRGVRR